LQLDDTIILTNAGVAAPHRQLARAALAGAAATRIIDLDRERRAEAAQAAASRRQDLDETRRLAHMVLAARNTGRCELAATVVNALAHYQSSVDPDTAMRHITAIMNGRDGDTAESEAWLRGQIARLTGELRST
jgi:hypothetical protein